MRDMFRALLLVLTAMSPVHAADVPAEARVRFEAGDAAYRLGDFQGAIEAWKASYQIHPAPLLLYNLGQAYRQLGDNEKAIFSYRQYVSVAPAGRYRAVAERKIAELEVLVEQQRRAQKSPPAGSAGAETEARPGEAPSASQARGASRGNSEARAAGTPTPATSRPAPAATAPRPPAGPADLRTAAPRRRAGIGLVVAGGIVAAGGIALLAWGVTSWDGANDLDSLRSRNEQRSVATAWSIGGGILAGIGAAGLAAGIVLGLPTRGERHARLWLAPAPGGLAVGGRF